MAQDEAMPSRPLGALFGWALAVALMLQMLQAMLYAPTGWSIEPFLGWKDPASYASLAAFWRGAGTVIAAYAYLAVDTLVFVPLYTFLFLRTAQVLGGAFDDVAQDGVARTVRWLARAAAWSVFAVVAIDLLENLGGFARLGPVSRWLGLAACIGALAILRIRRAPLVEQLAARRWWTLVALATLALAALAASGHPLVVAGAQAHAAKPYAVAAMILLPVSLAALWFTGAGLADRRKAKRGRFRAAVGDMVLRSRYVLLALAILAGLTIAMDQARDVVYAMAASPFDELRKLAAGSAEPFDPLILLLQVLGAVPSFVAATIALRALVFACWLWTRGVCQIKCATTAALPSLPAGREYEDAFAQLWARILGVAPLLLAMQLLVGVVRDAAPVGQLAAGAARVDIAWWTAVGTLLLFAFGVLAFGGWFLRSRTDGRETRYYDCLDVADWWKEAGFGRRIRREDSKYAFARWVRPFWLPVLAITGMVACRLVDIFPLDWVGWEGDYVPTLALSVIFFSLVAWLCFFGWLSLLEVRRSMPWVGVLVAVVAALSAAGLTDNHIVWTGTGARTPLLLMWLLVLALALVLLWAYGWIMQRVQEHVQAAPGAPAPPLLAGGRWRQPAAMLVSLVATVALGQRAASWVNPHAVPAPWAADVRATPEVAMARWLAGLCTPAAGGCQPALPAGAGGTYPVYFVSTEGGGIRAAAWTAYVLQGLASQDARFLQRTFSISGVSGGSVGAAAFRACDIEAGGDARQREACLRRWAGTDYLSPLLGAWMFEDALARVVVTRLCDTPGCGFLSRAWWFERSFEAAVPGMARGLAATRTGAHRPYLLLNATWVESGERAIASDLQVDPAVFPAARDELALARRDLSITTAAHNSARFPYSNAIGALQARRGDCDRRAGPPATGEAADPVETCGHLADGGYFDNSGAQTTSDVLHLFQHCLLVQDDDRDAARYAACRQLPPGQRAWLRAHLVPQVLMIRNGVPFATGAQQASCPRQDDGVEPTPAQVIAPAPADCGTGNAYLPDRPVCAAPAKTLVEFTGPPMTLLNVSGIRANGLLPHARQEQAVRDLRAALGGAAARDGSAPVRPLDLVQDGVRYPLGWHLSPRAREGIARQAGACRAAGSPAPALAGHGAPPRPRS